MSKSQLNAFMVKVDADSALKARVVVADADAVVAIALEHGHVFSPASWSRAQRGWLQLVIASTLLRAEPSSRPKFSRCCWLPNTTSIWPGASLVSPAGLAISVGASGLY